MLESIQQSLLEKLTPPDPCWSIALPCCHATGLGESARLGAPVVRIREIMKDTAPHQLLLILTSHAGMLQLCWRGHSGAMLMAMPFT